MNAFARLLRRLSELRFRLLGLATIPDIPTARFNELVHILVEEGWKPSSTYQGIDAWLDYGRVTLRKGGVKLTLEWDNWSEGSIQGPRRPVQELAYRFGFRLSHAWRWSIHDDTHDA